VVPPKFPSIAFLISEAFAKEIAKDEHLIGSIVL